MLRIINYLFSEKIAPFQLLNRTPQNDIDEYTRNSQKIILVNNKKGSPKIYYPDYYLTELANRLPQIDIIEGLHKYIDEIKMVFPTEKDLAQQISNNIPFTNNIAAHQEYTFVLANSLYKKNERIKKHLTDSINNYENNYVSNVINERDNATSSIKKIRNIIKNNNLTNGLKIDLIKDLVEYF